MRTWTEKLSRLALFVVVCLALGTVAQAQDHDLEMNPAVDITAASNGSNWHSPDIKLGADFGDTSVDDTVFRGLNTPIYAKFTINGIQDFNVTTGIQVFFHYRNASLGETPPPITDASWVSIGALAVPHDPSEPFFLTREWPTDFTVSAADRKLDWTPPATGDLFHVRAHVVYPGETPTSPSSTDEQPDDNVAISLYESVAGIRDVDLVIVHDVSGSMITNTYAGDTYLAHAKARAQAFIFMMAEGHKLGVVAFGGCLAGDREDIWDVPATPLELATLLNKSAATGAVSTNVTVPNAGCLTPLGAGVERAIQILNAEPPDPSRKRAILLLSDGWENSGSPRACNGSDPTAPCLGTSILSQLQTGDIRLYSIALGAAAGTDCLECLPTNTGGAWYAPAGPGIDLAEVYAHMQQSYSADDLYRADTGVSGGNDDTYRTFFEGADDLLYFGLQTDRLDAELGLEIQPPGGSWLPSTAVPGASVHKDRGYEVVRVTNPAAGEWAYRVVGKPRQAYLVTVRSDRVETRLRLDLISERVVGSPIRIKTTLMHRDEPIRRADLVAVVQAPAAVSFESLLRRLARQQIAQAERLPLDPDLPRKSPDLSPRALFVKPLAERLTALQKPRTLRVPLREVEPGVYEGTLEELTRIAGEYRVTVEYTSEKAHRTWSESVRLRPGRLDPDRSFAELAPIRDRSGRVSWLLRVHPADAFGNAVLLDKASSRIEASIAGGRLARRPSVAFDSAIQQELIVEGRREPVLESVSIDGRKIPIRRHDDLDDR